MESADHQLFLPLVKEENICLPLPINVVSRYWNVNISLNKTQNAVKKYAGFTGSVLIEGIETAESHGLACKIINSSLDELKKIIDSGIPPIVILPGIPEITQHASVITGYDVAERTITHYIQKSDSEGKLQEGAIPQDIFDNEWSEESRLAIIIAPPDVLSSVKFKDDSQKANRLCLMSERFVILGDTAQALESLKQAIKIDSENTTATYLMGTMLNSQNSPDCKKFYEKCLEINNKSYLALNGLGNFYLKIKQYTDAEKYYTDAIKINPKRSAKIYKNRAFVREQQDKKSDAKKDLELYLKYFPKAADRAIIEQAIREL